MRYNIQLDKLSGSEIAIIGMSCRFPGANNPDAFWRNLRDGVESITFLSDEALLGAGVDPQDLQDPNYIKAAPLLENFDCFDARFFGYSPREAELIDPQQRFLLECSWEALEHAGYDPATYDDLIGVYAGSKSNTYLFHLASDQELVKSTDFLQLVLGGDMALLSTRISYKLDLKGPSYAVQTACSTSLVAIHLACQSLIIDECRMALAGSVAINVPHVAGYRFQEGGILSPDGHCRPFDVAAGGTVFGSGAGMVVLKRLEDALTDGDTIHAIIRATATNNDGAVKATFTAPSVDGQADVILDALAYSGLDAEDISYIETHGTGTSLGDPIEIMALTNAFRASTERKQFCAIGSVKSNVGHLDAAAGISSLIKTVMALKHKQLPPSLHCTNPNPRIDFSDSPFYVNTTLNEWRINGQPRRAGVSSFGFGGTNAHIVLEEAPPRTPSTPSDHLYHILHLSGRTEEVLNQTTERLIHYLQQEPEVNLADVAYTLQMGRRPFSHRRIIVGRDRVDVLAALEHPASGQTAVGTPPALNRPLVFMFSGQGSQYVNMGRGLYDTEPVFQHAIDQCVQLLHPHLDLDIRTLLYPEPKEEEQADAQLNQTRLAQPALFTVEYALVQLWQSWGIAPEAMIGHSIGEYVAACVAGVISLPDALRLVCVRGQLMQQCPTGSMLAIPLSETAVYDWLSDGISIAAVNGPEACVVSGQTGIIEQLAQRLQVNGVAPRLLHTSHAFHSSMMESILAAFRAEVAQVTLTPPVVPYVSNVTGTWIKADEATDPTYWATHLRRAVRFADGIETLLAEPARILLEVGPGNTLCRLAQQHSSAPDSVVSLRHPKDQRTDEVMIAMALGRLWLAGANVDGTIWWGDEERYRVPLPTYPFVRERYWIDPIKPKSASQQYTKAANVADWFYIPTWQEATLPPMPSPLPDTNHWLVLANEASTPVLALLEAHNQAYTVVSAGETFVAEGNGRYHINPRQPADYYTLIDALAEQNIVPNHVLHLWQWSTAAAQDLTQWETLRAIGFGSLLYLTQALPSRTIDICLVTNDTLPVLDEDVVMPEKALLLGASLVIPQEYPSFTCRLIDIDSLAEEALWVELLTPPVEKVIVYRQKQRWRRVYSPVPQQAQASIAIRPHGTYFISGGLGNLGYATATFLAKQAPVNLVLLGRTSLPPRAEWGEVQDEKTRQKIVRVKALEALGATVLLLVGDVTDAAEMQTAVDTVYEHFGSVHGLIHAAGVARGDAFRQIQETQADTVDIHFDPKVKGMYALTMALADFSLDFALLHSSLSGVLGGLGNVAYAAAACFLDAFAYMQRQQTKQTWLSVAWDSWHRPDDMANSGIGATLVTLAITPEEGEAALARVFADARPYVVVATSDLEARWQQWVAPKMTTSANSTLTNLSKADLERRIAIIWQHVLGISHAGIHDNFFDLGGDSLSGMQLISKLRQEFNVQIAPVALYEAPTIATLVDLLQPTSKETPVYSAVVPQTAQDEIAIVGMNGRFPGAKNIETFWQNLRDGVESVTYFREDDLKEAGVDLSVLQDPNFVPAKPILVDIEEFDAAFFGYSPREAQLMDPQQRIFLECAWQALEHAGYDSEQYGGKIGVYGGTSISTYLLGLSSHTELAQTVDPLQTIISNDKDSLATIVSYKLNLKGPSIAVQTYCSTSLVAVHLACQSLLRGECDMALAGGVSIAVPQVGGYHYQEGGILSPDGHSRAFDVNAQGTVFGNGVGVVVLKRLSQALADGDQVYAVIKGSAINNDGSLKVGYTAPSVEGQAEVILMAQRAANVSPETIDYIEAHGTATALGDPIEIAALTKAFQIQTDKVNYCAIGSLKTNVGHLDRAAGVAALMKTVLSMQHGQIPPSLHFTRPNPRIDFAGSPFFVNTQLRDWPRNGHPRRAGVSALGFGGTNAHIILEEAPNIAASEVGRGWQMLPLSAKTETALETMAQNLADHLEQYTELNLADVAYTLQLGRRPFPHKRIILAQTTDQAITALRTRPPQMVLTDSSDPHMRPLSFLFPGQGAQYVHMGWGLYQTEPYFREVIDEACILLRPHLNFDLRQHLYPDDVDADAAKELTQTALAQPALFVIEYALAQLWLSWGVMPDAMVGHSIGEYVAACLAGVFSLEDALRLVAIRGRLMQSMPAGDMLALPLSEAEVHPLLTKDINLAAVNSPERCVVSGSTVAIERFKQHLDEKEIFYRPLHTSHAFHSHMMEPIVAAYVNEVKQVTLHPPQMRYLSNVTGDWITATNAMDPAYWGKQLRGTVRFADNISLLLQEPEQVFLEVGPGRSLGMLARQHPGWLLGHTVISSLRHPKDTQADDFYLQTAVARLWLAGLQADWLAFHAPHRRLRVSLPAYPFERKRFWLDPDMSILTTRPTNELRKELDMRRWFYLPSWKQSVLPEATLPDESTCWLLFMDECGLAGRVADQLIAAGQTVIQVEMGEVFCEKENGRYTLPPTQLAAYHTLFSTLKETSQTPRYILHFWSITQNEMSFEAHQYTGYYSLLTLGQTLNESDPTRIHVISNQLQAVTATEQVTPAKATLLGACRVLPQEYPHLTVQSIDISLMGTSQKVLAQQLLTECTNAISETRVVYRMRQRWVPTFEQIQLAETGREKRSLPPDGTYLITGGLESIGLILTRYLAQAGTPNIILLQPHNFPTEDQWASWLASHSEEDPTSLKIQQAKALRQEGACIVVVYADTTDAIQIRQTIQQAEQTVGVPLNGVIHTMGVVGQRAFRAIQETGPVESEWHFHPKVYSLQALAQAIQGRDLDFCLLTSSLASYLGGRGYAAYAASNLFVDAFIHQQSQQTDIPWICVNWDAWQMEADALVTKTADLSDFALTHAEVGETFRRIIQFNTGEQIVVSTGNLSARLARWTQNLNVMTQGGYKDPHPRPQLQTPYVPPRTDLEKQIVDVWQKVLGFEQIGIQDNFFELGGESFIAIQMVSQLKKATSRDVSVVSLYEESTIEALARAMNAEGSDDVSHLEAQEEKVNRRKAFRQKKRAKQAKRDN